MYILNGLYRAAALWPDKAAIFSGSRQRTWGQTLDRVTRIAAGLKARSVGRGTRVAILALNSIEYYEAIYALPWVGAVMVPLNTRLAVPELVHQLNDSGCEWIIFDEAHRAQVEAVRTQTPNLRRFLYAGGERVPDLAEPFEALAATAEAAHAYDAADSETMVIMYTGGTTGLPKGVVLPYRSLNYDVSCLTYDLGCRPEDCFAANPPLFHLSGIGPVYTFTMFGAAMVFLPRFHVEEHLEALARHRCTITSLVPVTIAWMLDHPRLSEFDLSNLKRIVYGSAPITVALLRKALEKFPKLTFTQFYGQTEASGALTVLRPEDHSLEPGLSHRLASAGRPHFTADVRICDAGGHELPRGKVGEVVGRCHGIFDQYLSNPVQTAKSKRDGWLYTGDAGYMDADGYVYVTDRIKDMIVTGGENVASSEPENAIAGHPAVAQVAVIGVPSEKWGEAIHAVIVLKDGARATADDIIAHCRTLIAGYKCPKSVEFRTAPLPLSGVGKIKKDVLRREYADRNR